MKKLLTFAYCLIMHLAVAQEQVTDFANTGIESPNQVQKVDTINGKLLFFINRPESTGRNLWVTDGTPENTRLLTDSAGVSPDRSNGTIRAYGYIYLLRDYVYRTKGTSLERVANRTDALEGFHDFNGRILLYYRNYKSNGVENQNVSEFDWLNADNTRTRWDENVLFYKIIDSTLHYIRFNYQTRLYELCKLTKEGLLTKNVIVNQNTGIIFRFEYLLNNGMDYYFFEGEKGRKMISKPQNSENQVEFTDWGNISKMPFIIRDSVQNVYFLKQSGTLSVYALSKDNKLTQVWDVSMDKINLDNPNIYGESAAFRYLLLVNNKIIFNATYGSEGINWYYLNVFDLKTGVNKRSRNLIDYYRWSYTNLKISVVDTNTYVLDNLTGSRFTYSFAQDSIIAIKQYPFKTDEEKDSLVNINKHTLLLAKNIYVLKNGTKTALMPTRQLYEQDLAPPFAYRISGDKILYWRYNPAIAQTEVWVSKGEKNDKKLLMQTQELMGTIIQQKDKFYFYTHNARNSMRVYVTDGTVEGTQKIFENNSIENPGIQQIKSNDTQIVFRLNNTGNAIANLLLIEENKGYQISFPIEVYYELILSQNKAYVTITRNNTLELYKIERTGLKLIDNSIHALIVYRDRAFYTEIVSSQNNTYGVYTLDNANNAIRFIPENVAGLNIYGDMMIYNQSIGTDWVFSVIDLPSNQTVISKIKSKAANNFVSYMNGAVVMSNLTTLLYIKGAKYKEYEIGYKAEFEFLPFNRGILIMGKKDLTYYDFAEDKATRILTNQNYEPNELGVFAGDDKTFLMIHLKNEKDESSWAYWSVTEKKLVMLTTDISYITKVSASGAISYSTKERHSTYWRYNGNQLMEGYKLPYFDGNAAFTDNGHFYTTLTTDSTGNELYQMGDDALMAYPEVVPGPEGIDTRILFVFNKQLYVYGFTHIDGWQVWKMAEPKAIITQVESPEERGLHNLIIYPNPTQDWLYIKSERTLTYRLINTRGQILLSGNLNPQQGINISQIPQGVYLIQSFDGGKVFVGKIVKE